LPLVTLPPYIALERALPCLALALQGRRGQWCVRPAAAQRPLPPLWQAPPRRGRQWAAQPPKPWRGRCAAVPCTPSWHPLSSTTLCVVYMCHLQ
jgi:hypothetical protein